MRSQDLRHRITIQGRTETRDANGDVTVAWADAANVAAQWLPGPGREYLAGEAIRAEVVGRFVIRYQPGITAGHRVIWDGTTYEIKAPPQGDATARRELTLMVGGGVSDG
ncbi:MAG: phage head closure protein [Luteimonas sp.]